MCSAHGRTWFEHLPETRCWDLVARTPVGRIAVVVDGRPEIFPVNHHVHDGAVVFRTDEGTKLHGIIRMPWVSFEVDGFDADLEDGWSVLVKGRAEEVVDTDEVATLDSLGVRYWGVGDDMRWLRLDAEVISGRRIGHGPADPAG